VQFSSRTSFAVELTPWGQLDAAAAGAEGVELELESLDFSDEDFSDDDFSDDDFSDDEEPFDSELAAEPLDELLAELLADSRLSLR
jgi:hypothetical protein